MLDVLVCNNVFTPDRQTKEVQFRHVELKLLPELVSINGKDVNPEQPSQALPKLVPELVSNNGKDVNPEH